MIAEVVTAVEVLTGRRVVAHHDPPGSGCTPAIRVVAELDSGDRVFAKAGADDHIAGWIDAEIAAYRSIRGTFMPTFVGAAATRSGRSVLVLEDLSSAHWPPPWPADGVGSVRSALDELHAMVAPASTPTVGTAHPDLGSGWDAVADDPSALLSTGLCSAAWLDDVLPGLQRVARDALLAGTSLCHLDVRSDNLCLVAGGEARLIDWNHACRANPELDLAFWVPSLARETGIRPDDLGIPVDPRLAVVVAGFFAARAGLPGIPKAPKVRQVQRDQLVAALPWAARCSGFAEP